ncbi:putative small GTPase, P-loop containing nucleoside triphosphate hydrolase [Helianthus annuus]|nr:putative small GTPase, P-loop containing nucleoside triphosphate hydrolase [Helianthus annuus]
MQYISGYLGNIFSQNGYYHECGMHMFLWCLQEAKQYAKENGLQYFETSAKTAENVQELFYELGNQPTLSFIMNHTRALLRITCFAAKRVAQVAPSTTSGMKLQTLTQENEKRLFCCSA